MYFCSTIYLFNFTVPVERIDDYIINQQQENLKNIVPPKVEQTKQSDTGHEGSIAVLTACIGCFIGIVMTSFIFLCCNPCHQIMKKQQKHFSTIVSLFVMLNYLLFLSSFLVFL